MSSVASILSGTPAHIDNEIVPIIETTSLDIYDNTSSGVGVHIDGGTAGLPLGFISLATTTNGGTQPSTLSYQIQGAADDRLTVGYIDPTAPPGNTVPVLQAVPHDITHTEADVFVGSGGGDVSLQCAGTTGGLTRTDGTLTGSVYDSVFNPTTVILGPNTLTFSKNIIPNSPNVLTPINIPLVAQGARFFEIFLRMTGTWNAASGDFNDSLSIFWSDSPTLPASQSTTEAFYVINNTGGFELESLLYVTSSAYQGYFRGMNFSLVPSTNNTPNLYLRCDSLSESAGSWSSLTITYVIKAFL
jgi:hypothetical protein